MFYHGNDPFTESHCIKWVTVQQTSPVASTIVWQAGPCCINIDVAWVHCFHTFCSEQIRSPRKSTQLEFAFE